MNSAGWKQFVFQHVAEVLIFSGLLLLLSVLIVPQYERSRLRGQVARSYHNFSSLIEALQIYSSDHPDNRVFPPDPERPERGIVFCPVRSTYPETLAFLTTPAPLLKQIPVDPFMTAAVRSSYDQTPVILHWVKMVESSEHAPNGYLHVAWGAMNFGPTLELPPQYDVTVFRRVPFEIRPLRMNLYSPSNGLYSLGILYRDSLGNTTRL